MKYVVKEPAKLGVVADADAMMREFNRAMGVVYDDVDQNNVSNNKLKWSLISHPVTQWESSTSVIGYSQVVYDAAGNVLPAAAIAPHIAIQGASQTLQAPGLSDEGDWEERSENKFWQYIEGSTGEKLSLDTLSLPAAAEVTVVANGQIRVADEASSADGVLRTSIYDIRILDGGQPLDSICTVSVDANHGYVPFHVSVRKLLMAGDHSFRVQIRDRSNGFAASSVSDTVVCVYGFLR